MPNFLEQPVDVDGLIGIVRSSKGVDIAYRTHAINMLASFSERLPKPLTAGKLAAAIHEYKSAPDPGLTRMDISVLERAFQALYFGNKT
jgi:hypothetical protein